MFVTEESALLNRLSPKLAALHCPSLYTISVHNWQHFIVLTYTISVHNWQHFIVLHYTISVQNWQRFIVLHYTISVHNWQHFIVLHYTISVHNWQHFIVLHYMGTVSSCIFIIWQLVSNHAHAFSSTTSTCVYSCSHTTSSTTSATNASISCQCSHASNLPILLCSIVLDRTKSFSWEFKRMRGPVLSDLCQRQHFKMYWLQDA